MRKNINPQLFRLIPTFPFDPRFLTITLTSLIKKAETFIVSAFFKFYVARRRIELLLPG